MEATRLPAVRLRGSRDGCGAWQTFGLVVTPALKRRAGRICPNGIKLAGPVSRKHGVNWGLTLFKAKNQNQGTDHKGPKVALAKGRIAITQFSPGKRPGKTLAIWGKTALIGPKGTHAKPKPPGKNTFCNQKKYFSGVGWY